MPGLKSWPEPVPPVVVFAPEHARLSARDAAADVRLRRA